VAIFDLNEANCEALCKLADARHYDWYARELRPEQDRRLAALDSQRVSSGGRALLALRVTHELLTRGVRERISIYDAVARERNCWAMLSKPRLDDLRQRIMVSVGASISSLKSRAGRRAGAVGYPRSALPNEKRYGDVQAGILTTINTALARLEAEGKAHPDFAAVNHAGVGEPAAPALHPPRRTARQGDAKKAAERQAFIAPDIAPAPRKPTMNALAEKTGIGQSSFSRWHTGQQRFGKENLGKLAAHLGVKPKKIPN
jgi:hypothetical protein